MKNPFHPGAFFSTALILLAGTGISLFLMYTGPETTPVEKPRAPVMVQTIPLVSKNHSAWISAFGNVIPARKVVIRPQVSGKVIQQSDSVIPGGHVREKDVLLQIDPQDYELALEEVKANLEQARFDREVESGRQVVARREWRELETELFMEDVNPSLALREPHLRRADAMFDKAENDIEQARLQLSRTVIKAPFNAMVVEESVEIGQLLSPNSTICELVGTDEFWIQATLHFSKLKWIRYPEEDRPGAKATVILDMGEGKSATWKGHVVRLLSDLDPLGRMARLIVSVSDPLGLEAETEDQMPLLLGSYVEVRIAAGELENVIVIPREALREGDRIWAVGPDNLLKILPARTLWPEQDTVLISNDFPENLELIVSNVRVPLPDMEVAPQRSAAYPGLLPGPGED